MQTHASRADVDSRATACPRTPKAHGLHEHARAPPHRPHERLHDAAPPRPCRALARARAVAAHLFFAQRPRSTWVSLQTARQVVKTKVEELRARPVHMASLVSCGCELRRQARPARVWCSCAHTQAPVHRDACSRFTRNLRSCPPIILYPLCARASQCTCTGLHNVFHTGDFSFRPWFSRMDLVPQLLLAATHGRAERGPGS